jgi:hypothetical protein
MSNSLSSFSVDEGDGDALKVQFNARTFSGMTISSPLKGAFAGASADD